MAVEVDTPPTEPSATTDLMCIYKGCPNTRVPPPKGRGKPSSYCAVHKPQRKERAKQGAAAAAAKEGPAPSAKSVESLHGVVAMAIGGVCLFVEPRYHPTALDVDNIFQPLERIYLRHATVPTFNPDVPDAMAAVLGISAYLTRVYGDRFSFGSSKFGGGARTTRTQAANARATPGPVNGANGGSGPADNDVRGAVPNDPASDHAAEVMAGIHGSTIVPGAVVAGDSSQDDF